MFTTHPEVSLLSLIICHHSFLSLSSCFPSGRNHIILRIYSNRNSNLTTHSRTGGIITGGIEDNSDSPEKAVKQFWNSVQLALINTVESTEPDRIRIYYQPMTSVIVMQLHDVCWSISIGIFLSLAYFLRILLTILLTIDIKYLQNSSSRFIACKFTYGYIISRSIYISLSSR